jgi:hypothetical protein
MLHALGPHEFKSTILRPDVLDLLRFIDALQSCSWSHILMIYGPSLAVSSFSTRNSIHNTVPCSCLIGMADNLIAAGAALQTICEAPPRLLISHIRELCQANAAIAEAPMVISQSSSYRVIKIEAEADRLCIVLSSCRDSLL